MWSFGTNILSSGKLRMVSCIVAFCRVWAPDCRQRDKWGDFFEAQTSKTAPGEAQWEFGKAVLEPIWHCHVWRWTICSNQPHLGITLFTHVQMNNSGSVSAIDIGLYYYIVSTPTRRSLMQTYYQLINIDTGYSYIFLYIMMYLCEYKYLNIAVIFVTVHCPKLKMHTLSSKNKYIIYNTNI